LGERFAVDARRGSRVPDDDHVRYGDGPTPLAIAHRGGAGLAAENTLEAFTRSYALGVRYLETDVRLTADGELVAFHDATLGRVTADRGLLRTRTLAELTRLRVLHGGRVLPLAHLLAEFPNAYLTIDVKDPAAITPLARLLRESRSVHRVGVAAARGSWLAALRHQAGADLSTALSWRALARLARSSRAVRPDGCQFAHVPLRLGGLPIFTGEVLNRAHGAGLRVVVWTVNQPATMHRLLDVGVDGIITDRPDLLREVMIARGQWPTPDSYGWSPTVSDLVS
jgi:glycerophosphoryl diester phosphodiesterase